MFQIENKVCKRGFTIKFGLNLSGYGKIESVKKILADNGFKISLISYGDNCILNFVWLEDGAQYIMIRVKELVYSLKYSLPFKDIRNLLVDSKYHKSKSVLSDPIISVYSDTAPSGRFYVALKAFAKCDNITLVENVDYYRLHFGRGTLSVMLNYEKTKVQCVNLSSKNHKLYYEVILREIARWATSNFSIEVV